MIDALPWLILFLPLAAAYVIVLQTRGSRLISSAISVGAVCLCFVGSCILFNHPSVNPVVFHWIDLSPVLNLSFACLLDRL